VLATGGGLLSPAAPTTASSRVFDATTGNTLWEFPMSSGVTGVPVSFQVDGKQYIAVQSGWGVDSARMQGRLNLLFPVEIYGCPAGRRGLGVCGVK